MTIVVLLTTAVLVTGTVVSVRNWNARCAAAREQFLQIHSRPVEGLTILR